MYLYENTAAFCVHERGRREKKVCVCVCSHVVGLCACKHTLLEGAKKGFACVMFTEKWSMST